MANVTEKVVLGYNRDAASLPVGWYAAIIYMQA
jgi:hypothetical protein